MDAQRPKIINRILAINRDPSFESKKVISFISNVRRVEKQKRNEYLIRLETQYEVIDEKINMSANSSGVSGTLVQVFHFYSVYIYIYITYIYIYNCTIIHICI